jgi:DNA end-binding protein Ku
MPRAIWSGSISFGLVNIPIKLYAAVSRKNVSFNQLDSRTGSRIKYKKVSAADGDEVPSEAIVKGYELSSGAYVTVGDDELAALDPEASRTIDIEEFGRAMGGCSLQRISRKPLSIASCGKHHG